MKHIIKRTNGDIITQGKFDSLSAAVQYAVKQSVNLSEANLCEANIGWADLSWANLREANLSGANLRGSNLFGANLSGANLSGADLHGANLFGADLHGANLSGANLCWANLRGADIYGANLCEVKLSSYSIVPEEGEFTAWKKLSNGSIAKLAIPADAQRVSTPFSRKCRASKAVVLEIYGSSSGVSVHDKEFSYAVGQTVEPDSFDPNTYVECSHGIHFFITRAEAEDF